MNEMKARQYQLDLLDYVIEQNGIIYLPTGAGKTFVAILALKRFSSEMDRTVENGGKRGIFMCRTVELAFQQAAELRKHTSLRVGLYVGERGVDYWTPEKWKTEIDRNQVFVGTAQIFLSIVSNNTIKITDLSIVIIDECHHGTKKDSMHEFMRLFPPVSDEGKHLPRVIGLTGVLLKGNKHKNIMESLRNLEITYRSKIITISRKEDFLNVLLHSTCPNQEWIVYETFAKTYNINEAIRNQITKCLNVVCEFDIGNYPLKLSKGLTEVRGPSQKRTITKLMNEFLYHLDQYGLYSSLLVLQSIIIELQIKHHQAETIALRQMFRFVITYLEPIQHMIYGNFKQFLNEDSAVKCNDDCHQLKVILEFSTPKVVCLLEYIEKTFGCDGKQRCDISCLVFVERRLTAKVLCNVIKKFVELQSNLKDILFPTFMVGRNSMFANPVENIIERKWNKKVMSDFHKGIYNLIVCSNVLEEGIDVQECNYVIAFDQLATFNAYIQSKGRARKKHSTFVIITSKDDQNEYLKQTQKYDEMQESVKKFLFERIVESSSLPNQDEIDAEFNDKIPALRNPSGAILLASSALSLLSRYYQKLPWDNFGCLVPQFKKVTSWEAGVVVSIKLPLQSRVKEEILSDPMENVHMAKISAAMKACTRLYEEGELNEKFLPTSERDCIESVSDMLFKHWEKYKDNASKAAGKTTQRLYERKCPEELYDAMPIIGEKCYANKIRIEPEFEPNEYNSHIIEALKTNSHYALLLRNRSLPSCAQMPLFMQQGNLKVNISTERCEIVITSEEELEHLRAFHLMILRDLLQCWRSYYVLDKRNKQNSFLIVPLKDEQIDWELVKNFKRLEPVSPPSLDERKNRIYRAENWLGKIIAKWYMPHNSSERFLVTKIHADQTPLDKIPADEEELQQETYLDYYESRYGKSIEKIVNRKQFIIEVKPLTSRRIFFNNAKSKNKSIKRNMQQRIMLLPELCHNFKYPGDLWVQAIFLPSILHRLHYLLHAEHLRKRINSFLGINNSVDYRPKPLIIDISLRRAVDIDGNEAFRRLSSEVCVTARTPSPLLSPPPIQPPNFVEENSAPSIDNILPSSSNETPWRAYEEPRNFARQPNNIYPIELQYFAQFEKTWNLNNNLKDVGFTTNDDHHLKRNLNQSAAASVMQPSCSSSSSRNEDMEDKRHIHILKRNFSKNKKPSRTAEQYEFLAALTTSNANDVFDMERFELLGDSFLKFSVSLYLSHKFPKWNEGFLTFVKSKLVSNRNLLYCALETTDIATRICSNVFTLNQWLPPSVALPRNFLKSLEDEGAKITPNNLATIELDESEILSGLANARHMEEFENVCRKNEDDDDDDVHNYSDIKYCTYREVRADKIIADTVEALLGVCVKNYGINMSFRMLEFFGIIVGDENKPLDNLLDLKLGGPLLRTELTDREIDAFLINYKDLETNLGYEFKDRAYLLQALTHPSFPTNRLTGCYQELEFIGDAILDMLITCYIFERNRTMTPGMLTDLRSALVNNITLGCICVRNRFHLFLLAESVQLSEMISKFDEFQKNQDYCGVTHDQIHILMEETNNLKFNISQNVEVPKVLGDIVEALIAAVYLDSRCLQTTWNVIYGLFERELNEFQHKIPIDPVRQLYEHPTANPIFYDAITDQEITNVKCKFFCIDKWMATNGFGKNKWQAKKAAAKHALKILTKA